MKRSILLTTFASVLALASVASTAQAAPPAEPAPAPAATAPAGTESLTDAQRVGRFFRGSARSIGSGLKKTGQFLGKGINKMIEKGAPKEAAPAAKP
jgi:hypothetical protein